MSGTNEKAVEGAMFGSPWQAFLSRSVSGALGFVFSQP